MGEALATHALPPASPDSLSNAGLSLCKCPEGVQRVLSWGAPPTPSLSETRSVGSPSPSSRSASLDSHGSRQINISELPDHVLLACFAQLDWATRFQVVPLVCRSWAELASSAAPELWGSVTVDFTSHMWLRAGRLAAWLRRRGSAICSLSLLNSDSSLTPWVRGWVPGSRMRHSMHDFYPLSEEGLARVLAPLHALRELRIARCDDLLQRGALACALRALPLLERLELTTTDPAAWRGVEWRSLRRLRTLALRHGPLNISAWPPSPLALGAEEADPETGFPLPLADLRGLTSLLVHHQEMRALPDDIALLTELRSLTLCGRSLRELPAAVGSLPALEELSLRSCPLGERGMPGQRGAWALPPELARCPLRRLDLMNCQLEALPVAVGSLAALEELSLGYNRLTWLPDNLAGLAGLRSLSLFGNDFDRVPAGLQALTRLEELFMDENPRLQFGQGAAVLLRLPRLRCLSVMQDSSPDEGSFDFWSESSICFLHQLDEVLRQRHSGRGYVRLH